MIRKIGGTTAVGVSLFVAIMITCSSVRAEDRIQAEFDRVAKMSTAEQQAWLQQLEKRAARAAKLTLLPKEAARQEARTHSLLHQKTVTWKVLREVIEDTETREKAVAKTREVSKPVVAKPHAAATKTAKARAAVVAKPMAAEKPAVTVNVEELEARIAAANLALRELEAELAEKTAWNATKLEPLADQLKTLVVRCNDLNLYRDAMPKEQRAETTKLESPKSAISQLSGCVVEARKRANDPQYTGDEVERRAELARLDAVSHGLADLAGK